MRVLFTFAAPTFGSNPYTEQLARSMPADIQWEYWSWGRALTWRYDVVHVHWPEYMLRHDSAIQALIKQLLALALLARWRIRRVAVVETIHNERPHEPGSRIERYILRHLESRVNAWIKLNPATTDRPPYTGYIPLGHYVDWFSRDSEDESIPGRLLFFGLVRPYKGVESLIASFTGLPDPRASLHVTGRPHDDETRDRITSLASADLRVTVELRHLDDNELAKAIRRAEAVVLPYQNMFNSSAALAALSLDRPIIVSRSQSMEALAEEVGSCWVHLLEGPMSSASLSAARSWLALTTADRANTVPNLSNRGWKDSGEVHAETYERARSIARAKSRARQFRTAH